MEKRDQQIRNKVRQREKPFSDAGFYHLGSMTLIHLIAVYERHILKPEKKGLTAFWDEAEKLNKEGHLSAEEMSILRAANNGSLWAIQRLINAEPTIIELPFIATEMIAILWAYKKSEIGKDGRNVLDSIRRDVWPSLLPTRKGGSLGISDKSLKLRITRLMRMPIARVIEDLRIQKFLDEQGHKTTTSKSDLSQLMSEIEAKGYVTKELACQIVRSSLPVNQKRLRHIRIQERPGRPVSKYGKRNFS